MPDSTPWTMGELVRAITGFADTLKRIEDKLEDRPDWADINRIEGNRDKEQGAQDLAIKDLEDRYARAMGMAVAGLLAALTAAGGWIVSLLGGG